MSVNEPFWVLFNIWIGKILFLGNRNFLPLCYLFCKRWKKINNWSNTLCSSTHRKIYVTFLGHYLETHNFESINANFLALLQTVNYSSSNIKQCSTVINIQQSGDCDDPSQFVVLMGSKCYIYFSECRFFCFWTKCASNYRYAVILSLFTDDLGLQP